AEPARAEQQVLRVEQFELAFVADLGSQRVARVAGPLLRRERARKRDLVAVPLPVGEPADERHGTLVAELGQRLRGERRAVARGAVEDDRRRVIGYAALDPRLEAATG